MSKVLSRLRRAAKTRIKVAGQEKPRLSVYKSNSNLYAQIVEPKGSKVLVTASTNEKDNNCLLYTSPSPRDATLSRMPSSA